MSVHLENAGNPGSTFGLKLDQLADLFAVAAEDRVNAETCGTGEDVADMLRHELTAVAPDNSHLASPAGPSLLQVLLSPQSSANQLEAIKERSKSLTLGSASGADHAVATTIYYAAIAGCLLHHGQKISQHSYDTLARSFSQLSTKSWMVPPLAELFGRAVRMCQSKQSEK